MREGRGGSGEKRKEPLVGMSIRPPHRRAIFQTGFGAGISSRIKHLLPPPFSGHEHPHPRLHESMAHQSPTHQAAAGVGHMQARALS